MDPFPCVRKHYRLVSPETQLTPAEREKISEDLVRFNDSFSLPTWMRDVETVASTSAEQSPRTPPATPLALESPSARNYPYNGAQLARTLDRTSPRGRSDVFFTRSQPLLMLDEAMFGEFLFVLFLLVLVQFFFVFFDFINLFHFIIVIDRSSKTRHRYGW